MVWGEDEKEGEVGACGATCAANGGEVFRGFVSFVGLVMSSCFG